MKVRVYNRQTRFIFPRRLVESEEVIDGRFQYAPLGPFLTFYLPSSEKELRIIQESYQPGTANQKARIQDIFHALTPNQKAMIQNILQALIQNQTTNDLTRRGKQGVNRK